MCARVLSGTLATLAAVVIAQPAIAGGILVGENGSQGMQRAGAFAAKADDPTALYFNPAGLAKADSIQIFVGLNYVSMSSAFQREGAYEEQPLFFQPQPDYVGEAYPRVEHLGGAQPIPFVALALPRGRFTFAAGVFAPHGYAGREFPTTVTTASGDDAPAPQRYDTVTQAGLSATPSIGLGYRANPHLSLGVRASWGFAVIESRKVVQGLPSAEEMPGLDTDTTVAATDPFAFTWGLGAHYRTGPYEVSVTYSAPTHIDAVGTAHTVLGEALLDPIPGFDIDTSTVPVADSEARCAPGGTPEYLKACVYMTLPQTATAALRWVARDRSGREIGDVEFDVKWEDWTGADEYRLVVDGKNNFFQERLSDTVFRLGYQDSYSFRLGAARKLEREARSYEVRGGLAYDTATTPVSWTTLDGDGAPRLTFAGGVGIGFAKWKLDVGAAFISSTTRWVKNEPVVDTEDMSVRRQPDVAVPTVDPDEQPYHPYNAGVYWRSYLVGSVGVTAWW